METTTKNILHVIAPVSFGGGETLLLTLLKEKRNNINEEILLLYSAPRFEHALKENGIQYYVLSNDDLGHGVGKAKALLKSLRTFTKIGKVKKLVKKNGYEIIHAHGYPASCVVALLPGNKNSKKIYTHHTIRLKANWIEKIVFTKVYNRFDVKTGVSDAARDSMNQVFPKMKKKFVTVYNCLNPIFFQKIPLKKNNSVVRFVYVARFTKVKNQALIVECVNQLPDDYKERLQIVFVGDGELRKHVEEMVKEYHLEKQFIFMGAKEPDEIPGIMDTCDFGISASTGEGFGIGIAECMSRGLPVVALKNGVVEEVIQETGYLADADGFANAMIHAMNEGNEAKRTLALERSKAFNVKRIKDEYIKLYI